MSFPVRRRQFFGIATGVAGALALPATLGALPAATADVGNVGPWGDQGDGTYKNPVLPGDYSDADVIRVGTDYYVVSSTFQLSGGVVVLHSKDLVNWTTIGTVVSDVSQLGPNFNWNRMAKYGSGVYAPSIRHHDGMFWVYFCSYLGEGFFVGTATNPAGPWTVTQMIDRNGKALRTQRWTDICPWWDADGTAYLAAGKPGGPYVLYLFRMTPDGKQLLDGEVEAMNVGGTAGAYPTHGTTIFPVHSTEGNKVYRRNGYYYLFHIQFQGVGAGPYMKRSRNLYGTRADGTPGVPGDAGTYEVRFMGGGIPSQGGLVDTPDGRWWWLAQFNAYDYAGRHAQLVPVTWVDDWPMPAMVWSAPKPVAGFPAAAPQGGDDFSSAVLHPQWHWNHQPRADQWSLTARPGFLRLSAFPPLTPGAFFTAGNTLCQRSMKADWAEASIKLDISGMADGQEAGLSHFNGGVNHARIGVIATGGVRTFSLNNDGVITTGPQLAASVSAVYLRSRVNQAGVSTFEYSVDGTTFTQLGGTYQLRVGKVRGDFVGIYTFNDRGASGYVDVDWFRHIYAGPTATAPAAAVASYAFDGSPVDGSPNGRNATLVNGPTFVAGRTRQAIDLGGANQHVSLPAGVVAGLTDFTVASWVRLDTTGRWRRIFDFGTGTLVSMFLTPNTGSTIRFAITTGGPGAEQRIDGTAALPTGVWKHVAVTLAGSTGRLYVDGVQVGQNTAMTLDPAALGTTTGNWIGRSQFPTDGYLDGQIDTFRIYGRALSDTEINALFRNA